MKAKLFTSAEFEPWRGEPRFADLLKKLDCADAYQIARDAVAQAQQGR